ncbi:MAG: S53 family peptidase [Acidobacteriaceae bacterium]
MNLLAIGGKGRTVLGCALTFAFTVAAAGAGQGSARQSAITKKLDETRMVRLVGNVLPEANAENDRGAVGDSLQLQHLQLLLQRPADSEAALSAYMDRLQTPGNPDYHHWLTAEELGAKYGPSNADVATVTAWLRMHGFQVNGVSPSGMRIDFSGTAGQVIESFKTEIHHLQVKGKEHFANMQDPQIPEALSPVVAGIASLNDFKPHPMRTSIAPLTAKGASRAAVSPNYTVNASYQLVVPADLQTIYDFTPVYRSGAGQGQTVILLERTDLYSNNDYYTFRQTFGLDAYRNSKFSVVHPGGCTDPGVITGDDGEASVDVEWAAAAAPGANIELASCADSSTNFGPFIALQSLIDRPNRPSIVSLSYGGPESEQGAAGNLYVYQLYQQAAAEGISVFVSAGDSGAASDSQNHAFSHNGINVSGLASTPFNLAAGGTDYADAFLGTTGNYWNSTNTAVYGSAKSYIPEIPWNDSCASQLITLALGYSVPYGTGGSCNSAIGEADFLDTAAGSGGPSACAYGTPTNPPQTSGTCQGYRKPSWQRGLYGNPNDGVRDLPDISLFAANGVWGHYYVLCYSNPAGGGGPCTGAPSTWAGAGGTSFVAPILAGVQALINQRWGRFQGNPNYAYYALANAEYGWRGSASCNSTNGTGKSCTFHDVTLGDMDVNCRGNVNCYLPSGTNGVLSVSSQQYQPAYGAAPGWDFATGIGTLDVNQVVRSWVWFK